MKSHKYRATLGTLTLLAFVASNVSGVSANGTPAAPHAAAQARVTRNVARPLASRVGKAAFAATGTTVAGDPFTESSSPANAWLAVGSSCLTAGTAATPATSIPACNASATIDPPGGGALALTAGTMNDSGMVVYRTPIATSGGLQVSFTDASFNGTAPGADGITLFLSDASAAMPAALGNLGGSLGYANGNYNAANGGVAPGLANGYVGIAFDEYGNYSNPTQGRVGGPGQIPETIAVRGAASSGYQYLGGAASATGVAASLPFAFDQPAATTRPANAPTITATLTAAGALSVAIDRHDGNGSLPYYSQTIVGLSGQPAVPANVYVGLTASTGGSFNRHQITGFSVANGTARASASTPTPTPAPVSQGFTPKQIPNLRAWFDPSQAAGVTQSAGAVSAWNDLSGNNNSVWQTTPALQPAFAASGINNLGSLTFNGRNDLLGANPAFSTNLFNESTVFVVSNQSNGTQASSVAWSGAYLSNPRWNLRLSEKGVTNFDFNGLGTGRLSPVDVPNGPAIWTAGGSISTKAQFVRKDGNTLSSGTTSGQTAGGSYPLSIGATAGGGKLSYQYAGQLGEMLVFNRALSATETTQVEGYLACKWGLQNRLPANHPYRNLCPQGGTYASLPLPGPVAGALQDPQQVRSQNGQLVFNVVASQASNGTPQFVYNGSAVPPTLRLQPGDTLIVNLTNNLPVPPAGAGYLNDTNLHYHGLHVSPSAPGDDSIDMMAMPGQALHYQIAIPANHPSGLYWYHSHAHGEAERQNLAGMSGALVIDGIAQYAPQVANLPERILVVRDTVPSGQVLPAADRRQVNAMQWAMRHGRAAATKSIPASHGMRMQGMSMDSAVRGNTTAKTRNPYVVVNPKFQAFVRPAASSHCLAGSPEAASRNWTLNGQTQPSIGIRPGEQQFWRLVNAGSDTYLDIAVDNTQMQIVGLDGVPLASVGNRPMTVSHYVVPPASRIEFIVTGPPAGTTAYLRTNCFDAGTTGLAMPGATLATINATTSLTDLFKHRERVRTAATLHAMLLRPHTALIRTHTAAYIRSFVAARAIARTQTLTYSSQDQINGQSYDPAAPPQFYAQSGTMEQWQIVNASSQVHTFHIHQTHFLVQSIVGGTPIEQSNVGQELDNINVPAATPNGPGSVTLIMDFTDPAIIGTFLLHCHILSHEDMGMMAKIRIGTAPPLTTSAPAQGLSFAGPGAAAQTVTVTGGQAPFSVSGCANVANASVTGAAVTVTPAGSGSCVLTVADASGLTASLAISVMGTASAISVAPNSLAFASTGAAPQTATLAGGTPPYAVTGCQNITADSISGSTLSVAPQTVGSCSLTVADSARNTQIVSVSVNSASTANAADNDTFHNNAARQGWNQSETALTTTNVNANLFGKINYLTGSGYGKVYAQPLFASNESVGGTTHNLVIVSTATDQVIAYDDRTLAVVWQRSFTNPLAGITQQSWTDTQCRDVNPDIGITGTPVIDRAKDRLYVVVPTKENGTFHIRLHALSLQNGNDVVNAPEVSASVMLAGNTGAASTSAEWNFNRSALLEANGSIYVSLGSHCDYQAAKTHGWVLAFDAASLAPAGSVINMTNAQNGYYLGASWMAGYGPAADSNGNVYFATGNGPWDGVNNFSMSDVKVPGNLNIGNGSYFTPADEFNESSNDEDLGSGGVMLLPDGLSPKYPHLLVQGGKTGEKYILNRDNLGGKQTNDAGALWHANTGGGEWGGPAFFQDTNGTSYVIYGSGSPLSTYAFNPASSSLSIASSAYVSGGCLECRDGGSQPVVSSNGTNPGSAIVWALQTPRGAGGALSLFAFDALTMKVLYSGGAGGWYPGNAVGSIAGALISPLVANGKVYVPTDGGVAVFGLTGTAANMATLHRLPVRTHLK